jgi:ABC-2 type transport system permease protein
MAIWAQGWGLGLAQVVGKGPSRTPVVWVTGRMLLERAGRGLLTGEKPGGVAVNGNEDPTAMLAQAPGWLWDDALGATADLAHPLLLLALAVSAGCFALLVLRRRQGA